MKEGLELPVGAGERVAKRLLLLAVLFGRTLEMEDEGATVEPEGVADWKSSKSSSPPPVVEDDCIVLKSSSADGAACFPLEVGGASTAAGVLDVRSSSPKSNRSTSGSLGFGGCALGAVRAVGDVGEARWSAFLRPGASTAPSSYSSYSSNLSRLLWVPSLYSSPALRPPKPPPSP